MNTIKDNRHIEPPQIPKAGKFLEPDLQDPSRNLLIQERLQMVALHEPVVNH